MSFVSSSFVAKLVASSPAVNAYYGYSIDISADGNTALVGAYGKSGQTGEIYIYTRSGLIWTEQQKITAPEGVYQDTFGLSVSLSPDGNIAVVGALSVDSGGRTNNGAVYVFTRTAGVWTQQQRLTASDATNNAGLGYSVDISSDGLTILAGAEYENSATGSAYLYKYESGEWVEQRKFTASDAATGDRYGTSVSLSEDGNTALIGAWQENTSPNSDNGAAYVYTLSGTTWTEQKLLSPDISSNDSFGASVSISADGLTAIVGSSSEGYSESSGGGAAYIYTISGSTWTYQAKLTASDNALGDFFGQAVAISADGNTALIGANAEDTSPNTNNGAAYIFTRSGSTWTQQQKILEPVPTDQNRFGASVAISDDGLTFFVGGYYGDDTLTDQGTVYLYRTEQTPSAPSITGASHGNTQVTLTFNAPSEYPEWVANYEYSLNDGATWTALSPADATSPVTITGLTNNVAYVVSLRALNSSGDAGTASTSIVVKPGTPTSPTITSIDRGGNYLDINFATPSSTGGYAISNYAYSYTSATVVVSSGTPPTVSSNIATITTATAHGVVAGYIATLFNLTADTGSVDYIVLSAPTSTTFTIAYTATNGTLTLGASPTSTSRAWVAFDPTDTTTPVRITGLTSGTEYFVSIRAINSVGSGLVSNDVAGTPSDVPTPPTITSITSVSDKALTVAFTAPTYDGTNTITNYQYSLDGNLSWVSIDPADAISPITITGLANGVSYSVTIRALTSVAFGEPSNAVVGIPATFPDAPSIFSIGPSNNALIISVTPPLNNGGSPIVYYQYSLDAGVTYSTSYFETNTILATGLINGTSYSVTVRAINVVGASPASSAVLATPADRDYVLSVLNKGLTPIHSEQDRYNFAPKLAGDIRILLEDQANYLTFNTIDSNGLIWVISDIEGWWTLPEPSIPDIERGFGDGSFDISGRNTARVITLTGSVLVTDSSRGGIAAASALARQQLISAFNLVKRGTWLIVDEDSRKRASFVRLSGRPNISTVSNRGRIEFSIGLKAPDPIKYEWIEGSLENIPAGTEAIANGYNIKTIGEYGFKQTTTEMYDKYGNVDYNEATTENFREYDAYGNVDKNYGSTIENTKENFREYLSTTEQTGVSGSVTVTNYGTANVYCYFRVVGPLFGPAEILNRTTEQALAILAPSDVSGTNQVLTPDETTDLVEYLDIDTKNREVHVGSFLNGQSAGSARGLIDPVVDWIYLQPGDNTISFTDYGTDITTFAPQLQIYWRSGWSG
jgi:hypothetical protein